jgi:transposase
MFLKQEHETPKEKRKRQIRNRMVYNDWGLYGFVQMLTYKCLRFGKELHIMHVCAEIKMFEYILKGSNKANE